MYRSTRGVDVWLPLSTLMTEERKMTDELPRLKPAPGEFMVECPKCHQHVSETCCAYQDYDYYKNCYCYIMRPRQPSWPKCAYGIITAKTARAATTIKYAAAQCSQIVRVSAWQRACSPRRRR